MIITPNIYLIFELALVSQYSAGQPPPGDGGCQARTSRPLPHPFHPLRSRRREGREARAVPGRHGCSHRARPSGGNRPGGSRRWVFPVKKFHRVADVHRQSLGLGYRLWWSCVACPCCPWPARSGRSTRGTPSTPAAYLGGAGHGHGHITALVESYFTPLSYLTPLL